MSKLGTIALFLAGIAQPAWAQTPPPQAPPAAAPAAPEQDPNSIEFALGHYVVTFNSHDADALAALWTEDGVFVDKATGGRTTGQAALANDFRELFAASPNVVLSGSVEGVRQLADDVAMVDGTTITVTPGGEPSASTFSAIFKRVDGKWLIDSVHESPLPTPETPRQALEPLAWMIGHWRDQGDAGQVDTVARWSANDAFIVRSYTVQHADQPAFEGSQVIGWDPRAKQIRSWTFNSDGSFGEGLWSRNRDEWLVRTSQTLADGRAATATQVISQVDADTTTVQTIGKDVEGVLEPAAEPVTVVRVADDAATSETAAAGTTGGAGAAGVQP
jgi:uncharacterized protein (TIGR02246 family)